MIWTDGVDAFERRSQPSTMSGGSASGVTQPSVTFAAVSFPQENAATEQRTLGCLVSKDPATSWWEDPLVLDPNCCSTNQTSMPRQGLAQFYAAHCYPPPELNGGSWPDQRMQQLCQGSSSPRAAAPVSLSGTHSRRARSDAPKTFAPASACACSGKAKKASGWKADEAKGSSKAPQAMTLLAILQHHQEQEVTKAGCPFPAPCQVC